jgi:hypothetical protein
MPWLTEAMKDVISCEKLRGGANNHYIRKYPNGAPRLVEDQSLERGQTRRTETSKYPEEEKTIVISRVVANEMELAQTDFVSAKSGL